MSQVRNADSNGRMIMASLFGPIINELAHVERTLRAELRHANPFIDDLAQHSFRMGGKRLRPALLLLTAKACGNIQPAHRTLAAVVEMIHTATLIHDDVLDEAELRRHLDTVNARWSNQTSVLLGDYLFTHAFYLASTLETTYGCQVIGRTTNTVCEGELLQTASSGNFWLPISDYYDIVRAKTAELCACCCKLGAHYAGASEALVSNLEHFGRDLGVAFQIADDLLDLEGDESATGKSLGTDLAKRKMTLPLIMLRDQLEEPDQQELKQLFESPAAGSSQLLLDWLTSSGALDAARDTAVQYADQAAQRLTELNDGEPKQTLLTICHFVVNRGT